MPKNQSTILTAEELSFYRANGFVISNYKLVLADLERLQSQTLKVITDNPHRKNLVITTAHVPRALKQGSVSNGELMEFAWHASK